MPSRRTLLSLAITSLFVVAACGGTTATTGPGGATQGPAATQAGGGGGGAGDYTGKLCDLLTPGEVEGIMGVSSVTTEETPIANGAGSCEYLSGDQIKATISYTGTVVAQGLWDAYKVQTDAVVIPGVGDGAIYLPSMAMTLLFKHGVIIGIVAGESDASAEDRAAWEKEMAKKIADRL